MFAWSNSAFGWQLLRKLREPSLSFCTTMREWKLWLDYERSAQTWRRSFRSWLTRSKMATGNLSENTGILFTIYENYITLSKDVRKR